MIKIVLTSMVCGKTHLSSMNNHFVDLDHFMHSKKDYLEGLDRKEFLKALDPSKIYLLNITRFVKYFGIEKLEIVEIPCIVLPKDVDFRCLMYIKRESFHQPPNKIKYMASTLQRKYKKAERYAQEVKDGGYNTIIYFLKPKEFLSSFFERMNITFD